MKRLIIRVLLALLVLAILRVGLPLAVGAWHYRNTPTMREWVRERPVQDSTWDQAPGEYTEVSSGTLVVGEPEDGPERYGAWETSFLFEHGNEVLLDLDLEVRYGATEVEGWEEAGVPSERIEGVTAMAAACTLDPDFHGVVVLTYGEPAPDAGGGPRTSVDVFVLAGPGEVRLIEREGALGAYALDGSSDVGDTSGLFLRSLLLGWMHPAGGPPENGIAYHARSEFGPDWTRMPNGGTQSATTQPWDLRTNTRQYSTHMRIETTETAPFDTEPKVTQTTDASLSYTWNDVIW